MISHTPRWDFSRYNVIVKQVEGTADILRDAAARVEPLVAGDPVARRLLKHLREATAHLDERALRMLALYDPAAEQMVRDGVKIDPRRWRTPAPSTKDLRLNRGDL